MGNLLSDEEAKAAQGAAKLGSETVEAASGFTRYLGKVLGTLPEDLVGLGGDYLREIRKRNLLKMWAKTEKVARERGYIDDPRQIPPRSLVPAVEAASLEDDDELSQLWANLLANASDPNSTVEIDPSFIEILKRLVPLDARVLRLVYGEWKLTFETHVNLFDPEIRADGKYKRGYSKEVLDHLKADYDAFRFSLDKLFALRTIDVRENTNVAALEIGGTKFGEVLFSAVDGLPAEA